MEQNEIIFEKLTVEEQGKVHGGTEPAIINVIRPEMGGCDKI
jgi:hypothetical protein